MKYCEYCEKWIILFLIITVILNHVIWKWKQKSRRTSECNLDWITVICVIFSSAWYTFILLCSCIRHCYIDCVGVFIISQRICLRVFVPEKLPSSEWRLQFTDQSNSVSSVDGALRLHPHCWFGFFCWCEMMKLSELLYTLQHKHYKHTNITF